MLSPAQVVFLFDVDNTLLDNDRFAADLTARLDDDFGKPARERYWSIYAALEHLRTIGATAILSDGDIVFQPRKIQRSGLWDAVDGRVLVTPHKARRLDLVQRRFPAGHYVMIEDKPQLLAAMKQILGVRLTTVFVRQGQYATESAGRAIEPAPDIGVENIGDLCELSLVDFHAATVTRAVNTDRERTPETRCQE